jgi:hypothetical protein
VHACIAQRLVYESQGSALKGGDMRRIMTWAAAGTLLILIGLMPLGPVAGRPPQLPPECQSLAFSTEEEFVTQGPVPSDGNPIISDGDLLSAPLNGSGACIICARNADLLLIFQVPFDLGLDAADVIAVESYLVAFSTELNSSNAGQFTAGDLLVTNGVIIRNQALTAKWNVGYDLGLDSVQFVGDPKAIVAFLTYAESLPQPISGGVLAELFAKYPAVDIWFSTEGTWLPIGAIGFLDGDLLSARNGVIVASNAALLPGNVPGGIPDRGVDLGLDAVTVDQTGERSIIDFSTELLYNGQFSFTDGDVLRSDNGVTITNNDLIRCFEPKARFLGLDALDLGPRGMLKVYLPVVLRNSR